MTGMTPSQQYMAGGRRCYDLRPMLRRWLSYSSTAASATTAQPLAQLRLLSCCLSYKLPSATTSHTHHAQSPCAPTSHCPRRCGGSCPARPRPPTCAATRSATAAATPSSGHWASATGCAAAGSRSTAWSCASQKRPPPLIAAWTAACPGPTAACYHGPSRAACWTCSCAGRGCGWAPSARSWAAPGTRPPRTPRRPPRGCWSIWS
mmetsp:Transcript_31886/g.70852  ORF Transcript_31886/g.70852 Transcript_31886/m.70852 type:complete len:206 (-) Transcript_31886:3031-3648(-)